MPCSTRATPWPPASTSSRGVPRSRGPAPPRSSAHLTACSLVPLEKDAQGSTIPARSRLFAGRHPRCAGRRSCSPSATGECTHLWLCVRSACALGRVQSERRDGGTQSDGASGQISSGSMGEACSEPRFCGSIAAYTKFSGGTGLPASRRSSAICPACVSASASGPWSNCSGDTLNGASLSMQRARSATIS